MWRPKGRFPAVAAALAILTAAAGSTAGAAAPAPRLPMPPVFGTWDNYYLGSWASSVAVGDFTGDGRQDVALSTGFYFDPTNDWKLFLFPQTASGTLGRPVRLDTDGQVNGEAMALAAGDIDGDGRTDLVLAVDKGVDVYLQRNGSLTFAGLIDLPGTRHAGLADIDGDGDLDLVVNRKSGVVSLAGTGAGAFGPAQRVNDVSYKEIETGDVTGDGLSDIVGFQGNFLDVVGGRSDGTFADAVSYKVDDFWNMGQGLAIGDFNGDGRNDVAASISVNSPGAIIDVFTQKEDGTLVRTSALRSYDIPEPLVAADMNLDGRTDLVTLHGGWNRAGVYTQRPDGTMGPESLFPIPYASRYPAKALDVGDFNGDGLPDVAVADYNNGLVMLRSTGQVQSWGLGNLGQLGNGTAADTQVPGSALAVNEVLAASAGAYHNLVRTREGRVWAWGLNHVGQLGTGSTVDRSTPTLVPGVTNVVAVAAGPVHSFAIKEDGTLWAWGWNAYGQLGLGSTADRATPTRVPGLSKVTAIAGGAAHSLAVTADGSLWAWGLNHVGQLGTGGPATSVTPVKVQGVSDVVAVSAGLFHSLALTKDGQVWGWGFNDSGQLGTGTTALFDPVPRKVLSGASAISAGAYHSAAIVSGSAWTWGSNQVGQLGTGSADYGPRPVKVDAIYGVRALATGWYHNVVTLTDGSTWTWGWNHFGQLGTGSRTDERTPVRVFALDSVGVTAGVAHSLAITSRGV